MYSQDELQIDIKIHIFNYPLKAVLIPMKKL